MKQRAPQSFGILQYILIEKLTPINLIIQPNKDRKNNSSFLAKLMFSIDKNLSSGEFEKISKYKDLESEIEGIWHLKPIMIPVVMGAPGTVKKDTNEYL